MKKTVTATLCLALMISSVSVGAAEKCNIKSFKDYISDKQISIKTDKCFNLGEFIFENNLFSCIFGENKFPSFGTGNTDKPSVEVKPETDKPSVEIKPETDKPSVEVKPETDKPSVDTNESSLAQQVLRLVNEYRAQNGKKALVLDEKLNSVVYSMQKQRLRNINLGNIVTEKFEEN